MIATIRELEAVNGQERLDTLAAANLALADELRQVQQTRESYRVLVLAEHDESIEVYCDPQVRLAVACLPENRTSAERARAEEWALRNVPYDLRSMPDENIRPAIYSTHCLSRAKWRYYEDKIKSWGIIRHLEQQIKELHETRIDQNSPSQPHPPQGDSGIHPGSGPLPEPGMPDAQ